MRRVWLHLAVLGIVGFCLFARAEQQDVGSIRGRGALYSPPVEQRVFVKCKNGRWEECLQMLENQGATIHHLFKQLNSIAVTLPNLARYSLTSNFDVDTVEEDPIRELNNMNAEVAERQLVDYVPYGVGMVQAGEVWGAGYDGTGVTVCIIDSGIYAGHQDFGGINMTGNTDLGIPWSEDGCSHGTHVAGTIAAVNGNNVGVVGVAPGVNLHIERVFTDDCQWARASDLIASANRCADNGAKIISMSLSGEGWSSYEAEAFENLASRGILSVAAAGNNGRDYDRGTSYHYPASDNAVIAVAAVDWKGARASFSQRNDQIEISAPGVDVYSTMDGNAYGYMSGTSMACPHVSAIAALLFQAKPSATPEDIRQAMVQTARHPSLNQGEKDNYYGYGLVHAKDALDYLLAQCDTDCNDGKVCTMDLCLAGTCVNEPIVGCETCANSTDCINGGPCLTTTCNQGLCSYTEIEGCCTQDSDCDDYDDCATGTCSNSSVCVFIDDCQDEVQAKAEDIVYVENLTVIPSTTTTRRYWVMQVAVTTNKQGVLVEGRFRTNYNRYPAVSCITGEEGNNNNTCVVSRAISRQRGFFYVERLSLSGNEYEPSMNSESILYARRP